MLGFGKINTTFGRGEVEKDDERVYHPEQVTTTMEGTGQEILAFMLNNSGITETEYKEMTKTQWTTIRDRLTINDVIQTLKLFGYKLIAIPVGNYMLSKTESYQFVLPEDKIRSIDRAKGEFVNFKPITPQELKSYGVNIARQNKMHAAIFSASLMSDKVSEGNLKRANEMWAFKVTEPKKYIESKKKLEEKVNILVRADKIRTSAKRAEWYQKHKDELKKKREAKKLDAALQAAAERKKNGELFDPLITQIREERNAKREARKKKAEEKKLAEANKTEE